MSNTLFVTYRRRRLWPTKVPRNRKLNDIILLTINHNKIIYLDFPTISQSYAGKLGYIEREGFQECFPAANKLAVAAVFSAFAEGNENFGTQSNITLI